MKKYVPNTLTLLNLFCGCIAVLFAVKEQFATAALFVFLGIFFDFFDGFAARKLKVQSDLGLQLDSLADVVTSGLVPGITMYKLLEFSYSAWGETPSSGLFGLSFIPLLGFCITLASAYRLAKFNLDVEQQSYFKGLPTPANALFVLSLPLIMEYQNSQTINAVILSLWFLLPFTALSCYLLNSGIKLFALKFKDYSFKPNAIRYIFLFLCIILLIALQFLAIPIIILLYIGMSLVEGVNKTDI